MSYGSLSHGGSSDRCEMFKNLVEKLGLDRAGIFKIC